MNILRAELHRSRRAHPDRREALARINHLNTADSHRHRMKRWAAAASRWTRTCPGEISSATATAVMTARQGFANQSRARKERDPIEFSFHDFDFLCVVFVFPNNF